MATQNQRMVLVSWVDSCVSSGELEAREIVPLAAMQVTKIEATEAESNAFLRSRNLLGRTGLYTEAALRRKITEHEDSTVSLDELPFAGELDDATLQISELIGLGHMANLTQQQQAVWERRILGATYKEIGTDLGITKQAVRGHLLRAEVRLLKCYDMCKYYGLWDVYVELIHRICKARPCKRSENPAKYRDLSMMQ